MTVPGGSAEATDAVSGHRPTLVLCFLATVLDGFDLQSFGVAAPGLAADYGLSPAQLGIAGSASSLGLLVGALVCGLVADRIGRKRVLVAAVALFGTLSLMTPLASSLNALVAIRFVTGLGMGGALPMIITIAAENSSGGRRAGAVTMMYGATPIGGILASSIALTAPEHWRWIFYVGGALPLLLVPLMLRYMRESSLFRSTQAAMADGAQIPSRTQALFGAGRTLPTLLLWVSFLCAVLTLYLLLNWLPSLLIGKGFSRAEASSVQLLFNLGGALGALLLGWMIVRYNQKLVFAGACCILALALFILSRLDGGMLETSLTGFMLGMPANGLVFLLYGIAGICYPTIARGTGVGCAVAAGRVGSILGPLLAGALLATGTTPAGVLLNILPIVVVAALAIQWLLHYRNRP